MEIKYLKIFTDKQVIIETEDGTRITGIIETAANDLDAIEKLLPIQREHEEILISVTDGTKNSTKILDEAPLRLKDIFSIEILG
ncbi:hypothetical protein [Flagellimonas iocasae]|uniref:Uncharacterized protein n=1 Tax=Flagellimonas iocasae TaxID=2055905 RepID=A0ABW4Y1P3_9FLAO